MNRSIQINQKSTKKKNPQKSNQPKIPSSDKWIIDLSRTVFQTHLLKAKQKQAIFKSTVRAHFITVSTSSLEGSDHH